MNICLWIIIISVVLWVLGIAFLWWKIRNVWDEFSWIAAMVLGLGWSVICGLGVLIPLIILLVKK